MYSEFADTHCHLASCGKRGLDISAVLAELEEKKCPFLLDIGTEADDLTERYELYRKSGPQLACGPLLACGKLPTFLFLSAGIWPSKEAIQECDSRMEQLRTVIGSFLSDEERRRRLAAVGECGIDRHWNKEPDEGEFRLFEAQLELARSMNLPAIIHSRDAFDETFSCLKNSGAGEIVIHCFSYGKKEAAAFLDRGWYISLAGTITYAKKDEYETFAALLNYIPRDRLLIETDAPYLAPVPFRGKVNSPLLIEHTYRFAAKALGVSPESLAHIVAANVQDCFHSAINCS